MSLHIVHLTCSDCRPAYEMEEGPIRLDPIAAACRVSSLFAMGSRWYVRGSFDSKTLSERPVFFGRFVTVDCLDHPFQEVDLPGFLPHADLTC